MTKGAVPDTLRRAHALSSACEVANVDVYVGVWWCAAGCDNGYHTYCVGLEDIPDGGLVGGRRRALSSREQ